MYLAVECLPEQREMEMMCPRHFSFCCLHLACAPNEGRGLRVLLDFAAHGAYRFESAKSRPSAEKLHFRGPSQHSLSDVVVGVNGVLLHKPGLPSVTEPQTHGSAVFNKCYNFWIPMYFICCIGIVRWFPTPGKITSVNAGNAFVSAIFVRMFFDLMRRR